MKFQFKKEQFLSDVKMILILSAIAFVFVACCSEFLNVYYRSIFLPKQAGDLGLLVVEVVLVFVIILLLVYIIIYSVVSLILCQFKHNILILIVKFGALSISTIPALFFKNTVLNQYEIFILGLVIHKILIFNFIKQYRKFVVKI